MNRIAALAAAAALSTSLAPALAPPAAAALAEQSEVADAIRLLDLWLAEQVATGRTPGLSVAVVHDQGLVWSAGYGFADLESRTPATAGTLYRLGSVTKLFTATAILLLRDGSELDLDDPVAKHLPEFTVRNPFPDSQPVTLRHLLTQTSGLPRDTSIPYWTTHEFPSREAILASLAGLELVRRPGETYKYSNLGMGLLGLVVERVSGRSYADFLRERIFAPLGMAQSTAAPTAEQRGRLATRYYRKATDGTRKVFEYYDMEGLAAAGNVISNVLDLAEFAKLQFRDGQAGGAQILAGATLREMQRPQFVYPGFSGGRGLGFGVSRDDGVTFVTHGGWICGHRSHFLLVPAAKVAVIVIANADDADPYFFSRKVYDVVAPAIDAATAEPATPAVADPAWQRYVGTYTDPWGWEYEVLVLDGRLTFYERNYPPEDDPRDGLNRLAPTDEAHTFRMGDGETVVFELGPDGEVVRIRRRFEFLTPVAQ
jgi:CubicO group peptidase (beta-lactamase class C family)